MRRSVRWCVLASVLCGPWGPWGPTPSSAAKPSPKAPKAAPAKASAPRSDTRARAQALELLGRGYRLFLDGDYAAARKALAKIELTLIRNRDYVLYLLGQSELLDGAPDAARGRFHELSLVGGRFQTLARWRMVDCDWAAGRWDAARRGYEALLPTAASTDDVDAAVARARIAEALEKSGKAAAAAQTAWRTVWLDFPNHPLAAAAKAALERLGAPETTPEERIHRAKLLSQHRLWPTALEELALVPANATARTRDEADYWIGTTKFKMRRDYDLAAQKLLAVWSRLPGDDRRAEALFHGARAWSRADKDDDAIAGYRQLLEKFPRARQAAEASFLIGWLDFNRGRWAQAIPSLEETLRRYGGSQFADDARWYLGFSRWLSGDKKGALADFQKLAQLRGALVGGKGAYWAGRTLLELGRRDEALETWQKLVERAPFSYYATMARVRLAAEHVELDPFGRPGAAPADRAPDGGVPPPKVASLAPAPSRGAPPLADKPDPALAADPLIQRVDELLEAGLLVEAGVELRRGEAELIRRLTSAKALPLLFDRYTRAESFQRPHLLAESMSGAALRQDPHGDATVRRWWEQVYPRAYRPLVEKYAPTGDNPAYYLYTIMQKESAYNPHDVSYADAIGLLQMIPPTSRRVSPHIDLPYTDDVLYDPEGNIRFGAWYIGHLLSKFKKQVPIGAGSFNAGPKAMMKWLTRNGGKPLDEFIELCSYTQTREYMKKVVEIYGRYVWLYDHEDWRPDLTVDPVPLDDGIDY